MNILPGEARAAFLAAGWFEGRSITVDPAVPTSHPAHRVLAEFGGLSIRQWDMEVFNFMHVVERDELIDRWAAALRTRLVGIAEYENAHAALYIAEHGQVIFSSGMHFACGFNGIDISEAIRRAFARVRTTPMLLPDESEVMLYGEIFRHGDAEVLTPDSPALQ